MQSNWKKAKENWLKNTSLTKEVSEWALKSLDKKESYIASIENKSSIDDGNLQQSLSKLKKEIKVEIANQEDSLDDISLNTPNSYKLQISVPSNINYLMKAWAAAEGRDLSSVALQCLENGLRNFKSEGGIPTSAIRRYEMACEKRIALAEVKEIWEQHERLFLESIEGN